MRHLLLKTAMAGAFALAFLVSHGPAQAVSPVPFEGTAPLLIPIAGETEAVEEDLRPDEMPAGEDGKGSDMKEMSPKESEGSSDIEDETIDKIVPE